MSQSAYSQRIDSVNEIFVRAENKLPLQMVRRDQETSMFSFKRIFKFSFSHFLRKIKRLIRVINNNTDKYANLPYRALEGGQFDENISVFLSKSAKSFSKFFFNSESLRGLFHHTCYNSSLQQSFILSQGKGRRNA